MINWDSCPKTEFLKSRIVNSKDYDNMTNEWTFKNANNLKNAFIVGDASPEAIENVMTQIGLGQSKTNVQFGTDLKAIVSLFTGSAEGYKKEISVWSSKFESKHNRKPLENELLDNLQDSMHPDLLKKFVKEYLESIDSEIGDDMV